MQRHEMKGGLLKPHWFRSSIGSWTAAADAILPQKLPHLTGDRDHKSEGLRIRKFCSAMGGFKKVDASRTGSGGALTHDNRHVASQIYLRI